MELVVGVDVAALLADWLRDGMVDEFAGVTVGTEVPATRPARFVRLVRTGGPLRDRVIDDAQLTVESWAEREQDAHDLAQWCRALIFAAVGRTPGGHQVYAVGEFAGPARLDDPESDQPRYTGTYQVSMRATVTAITP